MVLRCFGTGGAVVLGTSKSLSAVIFSVLRLELVLLLPLDDDKFNMLVAFDELAEFDASDFLSPVFRGGNGGALCSSSDRALINTFPLLLLLTVGTIGFARADDDDEPAVVTFELDVADTRTGCLVELGGGGRVVVVALVPIAGSMLVNVMFVWVARFPLTLWVVVQATAAATWVAYRLS